jgi:hypothetical protein
MRCGKGNTPGRGCHANSAAGPELGGPCAEARLRRKTSPGAAGAIRLRGGTSDETVASSLGMVARGRARGARVLVERIARITRLGAAGRRPAPRRVAGLGGAGHLLRDDRPVRQWQSVERQPEPERVRPHRRGQVLGRRPPGHHRQAGLHPGPGSHRGLDHAAGRQHVVGPAAAVRRLPRLLGSPPEEGGRARRNARHLQGAERRPPPARDVPDPGRGPEPHGQLLHLLELRPGRSLAERGDEHPGRPHGEAGAGPL